MGKYSWGAFIIGAFCGIAICGITEPLRSKRVAQQDVARIDKWTNEAKADKQYIYEVESLNQSTSSWDEYGRMHIDFTYILPNGTKRKHHLIFEAPILPSWEALHLTTSDDWIYVEDKP